MFFSDLYKKANGLLLLMALAQPLLAAEAAESTASSTAQASGEAELRQAWRKEYAFLTAQKRELQARISAFEKQAANARTEVQSSISQLQNQALALEIRADQLQEEARTLEKKRQDAQRNADILQATLKQAGVTLTERGNTLTSDEEFNRQSETERLAGVFQAGGQLLRELGKVRRAPGDFYTLAGDKLEGEIIHYGGVASYGVADEVAGILVPAGAGELKLWREPQEETARALADGESLEVLPLFIHGGSAAVDTSPEKSVLDIINSGGPVGWLIILLGLCALLLIIVRIVFLRRANESTVEIADEVGDLVRDGEVDKAIELCRKRKGSTAAVVASALRNLDRERDALDDIINESLLNESSHLERFGTMILVIAAVSPLLGLLGTVTGMITTFEVITDHGTGDPQLLSGGISTALVTTELGLIIAIPTLLVGNVLSGWADRIKDNMQKAALRVINTYQQRIQPHVRAA